MRMAAFSSSYAEVVAAPRCCFVKRVVGLAGSPSFTTRPAPPFSVPGCLNLPNGRLRWGGGSVEPLGASSAGKLLVEVYAADRQLCRLRRCRETAAKIYLLGWSGGSQCALNDKAADLLHKLQPATYQRNWLPEVPLTPPPPSPGRGGMRATGDTKW